MHLNRSTLVLASLLAGGTLLLTACDNSTNSSTQQTAQSETQQVGSKLHVGRDYPLGNMHFPTDEQQNDTERTLRMNDPHKIGYVAVISQSGQILASWTIMGKMSSTRSQILNTQDTTDCNGNTSCVVDSVGDDGTYGDEECGTTGGVFFFDTRKVIHEICPGSATVVYSDAPQDFTTKPVLTENANVNPTSVAPAPIYVKPPAK